METIQDFDEKLDDLISSICEKSRADKEFMSHKYMVVSLHTHTQLEMLERNIVDKKTKLQLNKQYNLYKKIDVILDKKAHQSTAEEMYNRILKIKSLVAEFTKEIRA